MGHLLYQEVAANSIHLRVYVHTNVDKLNTTRLATMAHNIFVGV